MNPAETTLKKQYAEKALHWFRTYFQQKFISPIEGQFPGWALPREIQAVQRGAATIANVIQATPGDVIALGDLLAKLSADEACLFKRIVQLNRRDWATETEPLIEKTFHLELAETLEAERRALDAFVSAETFVKIGDLSLPRLRDFISVQQIEASGVNPVSFQARQYDEKFHILQAPQLFLDDVAYFRARCEDRDMPIAMAFVDIDDFKSLNTRHTETKVDRNLLPRFMQAMEAHMFHHGYAYRQGGDEYLLLLPSLSGSLSIRFLDELRVKLAALSFPDIAEKTTVSIGLCIADADCALTDRELLDRANRAKQFAKQSGKNCIATYGGRRFIDTELKIVPEPSS
jgi:diguanylate cyclase (GGDEF)-like protein